MPQTKIVVITPPPINILGSSRPDIGREECEKLNEWEREQTRYKTYMSKKRYAERIMQIAEEYEETRRVVGLNFWGDLVRTRLEEVGVEYDEEKLPGCGLHGALDFGGMDEEYFTDGLHLDRKGYNVLSKALYETMVARWPELVPKRL